MWRHWRLSTVRVWTWNQNHQLFEQFSKARNGSAVLQFLLKRPGTATSKVMAAAVGAPVMASCACMGLEIMHGQESVVGRCGKDWNGARGSNKLQRRAGDLLCMARRVSGGAGVSQAPQTCTFRPPSELQEWSGSSRHNLEKVTTSKANSGSNFDVCSRRLCKLGLKAEQQRRNHVSSSSHQEWEVSPSSHSTTSSTMCRRMLLSSVLLSSTSLSFLQGKSPALASSSYREYIDRLDGYIFSYPSGWIQVRGAGADVFFRDPVNLDENVVVDFSSPSSSRYKSVEDLGTPQQAAQKVLKQKITEFMSTRLGVRRESKVVSAKSRVGDDGRLYYDIEVDVKSYANTNELAVMPADRVAKLEWSRRYLSTLGVENNRLYELRLQAPEKVLAQEGMGLRQIMNSFQLVKLEG